MQLPETFKTKYTQLLGEEDGSKFLTSFERPVNHGFRVNPLKQNHPTEVDLTQPTPHCRFGYYGEVNGKTVDHQSGAVYSQEPSAMFVGEVAHPKPGERVLDLCAAPGGKTTHIGSYMDNQGLLIANEIDAKRAKVLLENVERFGLSNTVVTNSTPAIMAQQLPEFFDRILVDAPCSGEGMFRKDPDAVKYWSLDYPVECARRQREILTEAVKNLKPGGELIYSTCTFAPEEDEQIIAWLVTQFGFEILPIKKFPGMDDGMPQWADGNSDLEKCVRIFPHHFDGEGHFIAKLKKPTVATSIDRPTVPMAKKRTKRSNSTSLNREQRALWQTFATQHFSDQSFGNLRVFRDILSSVPEETPDLSNIKIVREGLQLGVFKKNRFEPSYALALAMRPDQATHKITINFDDWRKYVHGDTFPVAPSLEKGWYLLVCDGQSVGFSKVVNGIAKNFFPKGLRFQA